MADESTAAATAPATASKKKKRKSSALAPGELNERQKKIVECVKNAAKSGKKLTSNEIADACDLKAVIVNGHLSILFKNGVLTKDDVAKPTKAKKPAAETPA